MLFELDASSQQRNVCAWIVVNLPEPMIIIADTDIRWMWNLFASNATEDEAVKEVSIG